MGRSALSRHLVTAKGRTSGLGPFIETGPLEKPHTFFEYLDRLSAAWLWRLTVLMSITVWGSVIWALVAIFSGHALK